MTDADDHFLAARAFQNLDFHLTSFRNGISHLQMFHETQSESKWRINRIKLAGFGD